MQIEVPTVQYNLASWLLIAKGGGIGFPDIGLSLSNALTSSLYRLLLASHFVLHNLWGIYSSLRTAKVFFKRFSCAVTGFSLLSKTGNEDCYFSKV